MRFYLFSFLIAYFQSSVLLAVFQNALLVPNLLLVYLFLNLLNEEDYGLKKALPSGFFLDLFQDSFGLHLSGYVFFTIGLNFVKQRYHFPSRLSVVLVYIFLSILERLWTVIIFRSRYYLEFNLWLALLGFFIEWITLAVFLRRYSKVV